MAAPERVAALAALARDAGGRARIPRQRPVELVVAESAQCESKVAYWSRQDATRSVRFIRRRGDGHQVRSYRCPVCQRWHLTSRER